MKKNGLVLMTLLFVLSFQAYGQKWLKPSSEITKKEYDFKNFKGLKLSNDFEAFVTFTDSEEKIVIEANENLHQYITVDLDGGDLEIQFKSGFSMRGNETLKAYISASALRDFSATSDSKIIFKNKLTASKVRIKLRGDSVLEGELETDKLSVSLRGDSYLTLAGNTDYLDADLRGDSKIEEYDFNVNKLEIALYGDSEGYLSVNETIDVKAKGDSMFYYKGKAKVIHKDVTGDSELIRRN